MRNLLKYLNDYKKESILSPVFKLLEALCELMVPLVMASMIDYGIKTRDVGYLFQMGGVLIFLAVVGLASAVAAQYFAAKAAVGFGTALRNNLFFRINHLSYEELDCIGSAALITRLTSDVNQVQTGVNLFLRLLLRSPFIVAGAAVLAFTIDARASLIFIILIPLLSAVVFGLMLISMPLYKKVQKQLDHVTLTVRDNLEGVRVIRAFNRQEDEIQLFDHSNDLLVKAQNFVGKISALLNPVTYVLLNIGIVVLIYTGAIGVSGGRLSQGQVVALVNYMSQILIELIKLSNLIITISKSFACANRINEVLKTDDTSLNTEIESVIPNGNAPKIQFKNVTFRYKNAESPSLENLSFQLEMGQTMGIIGGTGSGKTTLLQLLPRFYEVSEGCILIDGVDIRDYPVEQLRGKFGLVPQQTVLFRGTVRENMYWGNRNAADQEIEQALSIAQAKFLIDDKKKGLDFEIDQGGKNLSGGQRQRLTIARALVRKPEILILDDSSSALDFATDARLRQGIREETEDLTVLVVSQRASSIMYADKILVLEDGKVAGIGTHKELYQQCRVYREICLSQYSEREAETDEK